MANKIPYAKVLKKIDYDPGGDFYGSAYIIKCDECDKQMRVKPASEIIECPYCKTRYKLEWGTLEDAKGKFPSFLESVEF